MFEGCPEGRPVEIFGDDLAEDVEVADTSTEIVTSLLEIVAAKCSFVFDILVLSS
jgi:hypothetical protein